MIPKSIEERLEALEKEIKQLRQQVILLETQKHEVHHHHHYDYVPSYTPPVIVYPQPPTVNPWQPYYPGTSDPPPFTTWITCGNNQTEVNE